MTTPELAPRSSLPSLVAVWVAALVASVAIGLLVPTDDRAQWLCIALGGCLILTFAAQVIYARPSGFVRRAGLSMLGALLIMGLVSLGFAFAGIVAGG